MIDQNDLSLYNNTQRRIQLQILIENESTLGSSPLFWNAIMIIEKIR